MRRKLLAEAGDRDYWCIRDRLQLVPWLTAWCKLLDEEGDGECLVYL